MSRSSLPPRLVLRRLGRAGFGQDSQDPTSGDTTDPGSSVTDPNLTGGSSGSSSGDWVSTAAGWVGDVLNGWGSSGTPSGGNTPASAAPQTAPTTANAAVPAAAPASGVSTTTLALIGGGVAVTGLVVFLATRGGGSRGGRRRNPVRRRGRRRNPLLLDPDGDVMFGGAFPGINWFYDKPIPGLRSYDGWTPLTDAQYNYYFRGGRRAARRSGEDAADHLNRLISMEDEDRARRKKQRASISRRRKARASRAKKTSRRGRRR